MKKNKKPDEGADWGFVKLKLPLSVVRVSYEDFPPGRRPRPEKINKNMRDKMKRIPRELIRGFPKPLKKLVISAPAPFVVLPQESEPNHRRFDDEEVKAKGVPEEEMHACDDYPSVGMMLSRHDIAKRMAAKRSLDDILGDSSASTQQPAKRARSGANTRAEATTLHLLEASAMAQDGNKIITRSRKRKLDSGEQTTGAEDRAKRVKFDRQNQRDQIDVFKDRSRKVGWEDAEKLLQQSASPITADTQIQNAQDNLEIVPAKPLVEQLLDEIPLQRPDRPMTILDCPHEVLQNIFKRLDPTSVTNIALTNTHFAPNAMLAHASFPHIRARYASDTHRLRFMQGLQSLMPEDHRLCCSCRKYKPLEGGKFHTYEEAKSKVDRGDDGAELSDDNEHGGDESAHINKPDHDTALIGSIIRSSKTSDGTTITHSTRNVHRHFPVANPTLPSTTATSIYSLGFPSNPQHAPVSTNPAFNPLGFVPTSTAPASSSLSAVTQHRRQKHGRRAPSTHEKPILIKPGLTRIEKTWTEDDWTYVRVGGSKGSMRGVPEAKWFCPRCTMELHNVSIAKYPVVLMKKGVMM